MCVFYGIIWYRHNVAKTICGCIENAYKLHRTWKRQQDAMYQTLSRPALNLWLIIFSSCNLFLPGSNVSLSSYASISARIAPWWQLVRTVVSTSYWGVAFVRSRPTSTVALKSLSAPKLSRVTKKVDKEYPVCVYVRVESFKQPSTEGIVHLSF